MAAEHAGAESPDPRALIAEIREWTRNLCTRTRSTYQSMRAADALEAVLARAEKAERELAAVVEKWPVDGDGMDRAAIGSLWQERDGEWETATGRAFNSKSAAVRAYCGLDPAPAGGEG